ncbi:hypothetical protein O9H85_02445 [Paenibacillus filicis]|uniref:Ni2+-binding GTPase n=1 Tax=Paenibacillus gyeongsangnamensis TaxID=3388067 RepID=A0ABT4Q368_9BACL|nr:hypothetical protein [Paenibacillus filicis]MCZ8511314.1 hypothetical protein [Paenibacillus filicis]
MLEERLKAYRLRTEQVMERTGEEERQLIQDLLKEIGTLAEENRNLRKALMKQARTTHMSSKLKDALME